MKNILVSKNIDTGFKNPLKVLEPLQQPQQELSRLREHQGDNQDTYSDQKDSKSELYRQLFGYQNKKLSERQLNGSQDCVNQ